MSDDITDAVDRMDALHRQWRMPQTCVACRQHTTVSRDALCAACRCDIRTIQLYGSEWP